MRKTLIVSNTSVARTVDINWTGAGEKTTLCQYVSAVSDDPISMSNLVHLTTRMNDGGTILDVTLNERRLVRLEAAIQELLNNRE